MDNRIRGLRKERKMTMKQLGEMLGVAERTVAQYETGKRQPDNETLLKLGEIFDVTVGYILGADENTLEQTSARTINDDDIKFALFGGGSEITDAMFDEVKNFAAFVKKREEEKKKE